MSSEDTFAPYAPGSPTVGVVKRIREGTSGAVLSVPKLQALGIAEGNAIRVQRALRFLNLTDESDELTEAAKRLRKATDDEYPTGLAELIHGAYGPVFEILPHPASASTTELENAFRQFDPAGQRKNMIRLFATLCEEAGLMPAGAPDAAPRRGRPTVAERKTTQNTVKPPRGRKPRSQAGDSLKGMLMDKFPEFNPEWAPEVQAKWFDAFRALRNELKGEE